MQLSERTRIKNHPERAVPEEAAEILSAGLVAHFGFIENRLPYVIPCPTITTANSWTGFICTVPFAAALSNCWQLARRCA